MLQIMLLFGHTYVCHVLFRLRMLELDIDKGRQIIEVQECVENLLHVLGSKISALQRQKLCSACGVCALESSSLYTLMLSNLLL